MECCTSWLTSACEGPDDTACVIPDEYVPDEIEYQIQFQTDMHPEQTTWTLSDLHTSEVKATATGRTAHRLHNAVVHVDPEATYILRLEDTAGNGFEDGEDGDDDPPFFSMMCTDLAGVQTILVDNLLGNWGGSKEYVIGPGCTAPIVDPDYWTVVVKTDNYPDETTWKLSDGGTELEAW